MVLLCFLSLQVAGMPAFRGGAMSQVLGVLRTGLVGGLVGFLVVVIAVVLRPLLNAWRAPASAPRPRWQYLLAALGWLTIASCFVLLGRRIGTGLPARTVAVLGLWSGIYGLVLIGRAASWGSVRALWWGPQSVQD
jgi:hypothetical protein